MTDQVTLPAFQVLARFYRLVSCLPHIILLLPRLWLINSLRAEVGCLEAPGGSSGSPRFDLQWWGSLERSSQKGSGQIAGSGRATSEGLVPHVVPRLRLVARSTARAFSQQPFSRLTGGLTGGYCEIQRPAA